MRISWKHVCLLVLVAVAALGLGRVRFDTDILSVLPNEMPEVRGLKVFHEAFSRDEELVLLLESPEGEEGDLSGRAEELAGKLKEAGVAKSARWQPRWRDDPAGLAELIAYLWLNGSPSEAGELARALSRENAEETLTGAMERVATAIDGGDLMLSAHDPFGFLGHSSMRALFEASEEGGEAFLSADERFHLLFVDSSRPLADYREMAAWLEEIVAVVEPWERETGIKVWKTGEPAFAAEIGSSMEKDMRGTMGITSSLIGLLFLAMQRRFGLLAGLGGVLGLVFLVAMGLAGWIYGELSIMAAGFAAILIGLVVDYGVLICQEAKVAGHDLGRLKQATTRSILWAAATTSVVFFALNLSGLPGIAQLGTVVSCGIVVGAVLMLVFYAPWVAARGSGRVLPLDRPARVPGGTGTRWLLGAIGLGSVLVLFLKGAPGVEFDSRLLRPRDSKAMAAFEKIQEAFPIWNSPALKVVVEARDDEGMRGALVEAERRLSKLREERGDLLKRYQIPASWWPDPDKQRTNRAIFADLSLRSGDLLATAGEVGFSEEGTALGRSVFDAFERILAVEGEFFPSSPAALEVMRGFVSRKNDGGGVVLGVAETVPVDGMSRDDENILRSANGDGIWLSGWSMLKPAVTPLVKKDLTQVFAPMAVLMVTMLVAVFRRVKEVGLALLSMAVSGAGLLSVMRLAGVEWNFLNIAALPLLLGTSIDYSIHMLLALQRNGGNVREAWHGTGKAVLFCGTSTAIGFGSLCFASNDALSSLGMVAVTGILLSMLFAVFLLPGLTVGSGMRATGGGKSGAG